MELLKFVAPFQYWLKSHNNNGNWRPARVSARISINIYPREVFPTEVVEKNETFCVQYAFSLGLADLELIKQNEERVTTVSLRVQFVSPDCGCRQTPHNMLQFIIFCLLAAPPKRLLCGSNKLHPYTSLKMKSWYPPTRLYGIIIHKEYEFPAP
jgi:hypothetical protein